MIDLHLHLDGSLNAHQIMALAEMSHVHLPSNDVEQLKRFLTVSDCCKSLAEYLEKFNITLSVLQTQVTISRAVEMLVTTLSEQGLCYAEIRFAPQLHLQCGLTQEQVVKAAVCGLNKGCKSSGMPAQLILCCMRGNINTAENQETVCVATKFLGHGVCAVDLAGNEATFPTSDFAELFHLANDKGLPFVIHAGEAAGPESVCQAVEFGAKRIGHGLHALEDKEAVKLLYEHNIPIEMCFSSNLQTKAAISAHDYPICKFIEKGIRITVNTDNMTVSGTTLLKEYLLLKQYFGFTFDEMKQFSINASDAAFLTAERKEELKRVIDKRFSDWLTIPDR